MAGDVAQFVDRFGQGAPAEEGHVLGQAVEGLAQAGQGDESLPTAWCGLAEDEVEPGDVAIGVNQPQDPTGAGVEKAAQHGYKRISPILATARVIPGSRQRDCLCRGHVSLLFRCSDAPRWIGGRSRGLRPKCHFDGLFLRIYQGTKSFLRLISGKGMRQQ